MMQTSVNDGQCWGDRGRHWTERESLLGLIASSLCRRDESKDCRVHFSRVTQFLPDFISGADRWIDYGLDMRSDCKYGGY